MATTTPESARPASVPPAAPAARTGIGILAMLAVHQWVGIAIIVAANVVVTARTGRTTTKQHRDPDRRQ